ncbi:MAG: DNA polymerase IV [Rhizomicrobium sp.]
MGIVSRCRKIVHIDMDAFFASVEQRDREEFRGMPIAVGHPGRRGVVAAASYEARAFGVYSAMPSGAARRKCPALVFVPPRMDVYRVVSRQIREVLSEFTPLVEPLSLDEAYLDVTANPCCLPSAVATASEIRSRIRAKTGLTASAGVSYNKFLAKLASDYGKPNGQFVITPAVGAAFVASLDVRKFHGVGPVTAEKMAQLGIRTGADLRSKSYSFLERCFGKAGGWYYAIARGEDERPVQPDRPRKSAGSELTFSRDLRDPGLVEAEVQSRASEVWGWCVRARRYARTITVKIRYADYRQITRSRTLPFQISSSEELSTISTGLLRSALPLESGVRLVGVAVSGFGEAESRTVGQLNFDL